MTSRQRSAFFMLALGLSACNGPGVAGQGAAGASEPERVARAALGNDGAASAAAGGAALPPPPGDGQVLMGRDGEPLALPARGRYTSGGPVCPGARCDLRELQRCAVHERVECAPGCDGYRSSFYECRAGTWRTTGKSDAPCACRAESPRPELAGCDVRYTRVQPSEHALSDQCAAALRCGESDLWIECDGENDGTGSSLCACWRDREPHRGTAGALIPREGLEACFDAAVLCVANRTGAGAARALTP